MSDRDPHIERLAAWLHDNTRDLEHMVEGYEWPLHDNDDGYRGDGAYVRLIPKDIAEHHRDLARRSVEEFAKLRFTFSQPSQLDWAWYAGDNEERYVIGPCDSREQALSEADDYDWDTVHIVEAAKEPVRLSSYFEVDALFEQVAEDSDIGDPEGDAVGVGATEEQAKELQALVRAAIDEWQTRHKLIIDPWVFTHTRNAAELPKCLVCDERIGPRAVCATDIELGTCHAACLEGSAVVDLSTGEPFAGPVATFVYGAGDQVKGGAA